MTFSEGGMTVDYLMNMPLDELPNWVKAASKINSDSKRQMDRN